MTGDILHLRVTKKDTDLIVISYARVTLTYEHLTDESILDIFYKGVNNTDIKVLTIENIIEITEFEFAIDLN